MITLSATGAPTLSMNPASGNPTSGNPASGCGVRRFAAAFFSIIIAATPAFAAKSKSSEGDLAAIAVSAIYVEIATGDSNFTVIDSRFDETATAGVLLGIVGAGINSGINAGEDNKKADVYRAEAATIELASILERSAEDTFALRSEPPLAAEKSAASHVLVIEIRNWGLSRADKDDPRLRAFLNLTWRIEDPKGKTLFEKKRENNVASTMRRLEETDIETFKSEMTAIAEKAGKQIAYQVIYR